ncbi:MAG: hypothetical protein IKJ52_10455 [Muribaculaceae bacterium]|nr:hypothetical protein [Muribaculaceae bacterium]
MKTTKNSFMRICAIMLLLLSVSFSTMASDATTWGLKGPVKYVSNIGISIHNGSSASFNKQGKATSISGCSSIKRSNGKISYMEYYNDGYECYFPAYFYYSNGKLSNIKFYSDDCEYKTKVSYNSKGAVSKESQTAVYLYENVNMGSENTSYQYISYDRYGNWTKRIEKTSYGNSTQTRKITYY